MRNLKKNLARFLPVWIPLLVVIADRVLKVYIQHAITAFDAVSVIPGWLRIVHSENPGAAFGVLAEGNPILRAAVLIGVSSVVLVFVISALLGRGGAFAATPARVGLSLVLGGAIGNLFDRIVYGTVTDFIEVYHGYWSFPAFNVADSAITVGAVLLLWDLIRPRHKALPKDARLAHK